MKDIVSVITTFYNAQDYILKCLNSVNNQLINEFFEIEFVLVDDCSTDDTTKIIKIFFDNYTTGNVKSKHLRIWGVVELVILVLQIHQVSI